MYTFHSRRTRHRILPTHTHTKHQQTNRIHNNPTLQALPPHSRQQNSTNKHGHSILNDAPAATDPVTNEPNHDLTADDTDNFEVADGLNPSFVANVVVFEALGPDSFEESEDVADAEEDVAFDEETETGHGVAGYSCERKVR